MTRSTFQTGWKRTVRIKDLLSDDDSPETARRVAGKVAARLKRLPDYQEGSGDEFSSAVDEMADIAASTDEDYPGSRDLPDLVLTPTRHFNLCLEVIYDWADAERVWIA